MFGNPHWRYSAPCLEIGGPVMIVSRGVVEIIGHSDSNRHIALHASK